MILKAYLYARKRVNGRFVLDIVDRKGVKTLKLVSRRDLLLKCSDGSGVHLGQVACLVGAHIDVNKDDSKVDMPSCLLGDMIISEGGSDGKNETHYGKDMLELEKLPETVLVPMEVEDELE